MLHHAQFKLSPLSLAVFTLLFAGSTSLQLARAQAAPAPEAAASAPAAAPGSNAGVTLPAVKASAVSKDPVTEGSGSYAPSAATIGKGALTLREIPQSVTVITREELDDRNITTIEGALKNVTGVTIQRFDATGSYTQFIARGYEADSYQQDGLNVAADTNGIYFDLAAYDRIEVQRGAAALFSGGGEPGITVNMVRKRALATDHTNVGFSYGSWDDKRTEFDVNRSLNESGTLRGRVVGVYQDFDTFMDGIDNNRKQMAYGTLELDLTPSTTVSVGATWQQVQTKLSRGLPAPGWNQLYTLRPETMLVTSWNFQELESSSLFAELEHRGDDDSLFRFALRNVRRTNDANYLDASPPAANGDMIAMTAAEMERKNTDRTADVYYSKPFQAWGLKHNLLVGADYRESYADGRWSNAIAAPGTGNLYYWSMDAIPKPNFNMNAGGPTDSEIRSWGVYSQLRVKPAQDWTLIGGGRYGAWKSTGISFGSEVNYDAENKVVPYAAAIYDVTSSISLYSSYTQIYKPQNANTPSGEQIAPRTGKQFELGLKGEAFDKNLQYTLAIYQLEDENRALAVTGSSPPASVPNGKARSRGFEADFHGEVTPGWSLSGGYAYLDTELLSATAAQIGTATSPVSPRHSYNLWTRHKMNVGPVDGVVAGFGLRGSSDFGNGTAPNIMKAGGYTLYSLALSAPVNKQFKVGLNVDNLFDKVYWEKVSSPSRQNFYGEPRRITVSLNGSF
jgi:iron complex outermembrane receptor protein/outer membrane receptor for ferric coprogen and ferric-rhodotorulic acid